MNPKGLNNLDPKLRETYERVMGTSFAPPATPQAPQPAPQPASEPAQNTPPVAPPVPQPVQPVQQPPPAAAPLPQSEPAPQDPQPAEMVQSPISTPSFGASNPFQDPLPPPAEVIANNAVVPSKKGSKLIPVLFTIGGIIFFVVYAIVWAKVFGLF